MIPLPTYFARSEIAMYLMNSSFRWLPLAVLVGFCGSGLKAGDWPNWRGPNHNGISLETNWKPWIQPDPTIAWRAGVGTGFSSVSVANGRLFTMGNNQGVESVYCFDAATGDLKWQHTYDCPLDPNLFEGGPTSTPTVDGERVYTMSRIGQLFCLNANDGSIVWSKEFGEDPEMRVPGWGFGGSPLVLGRLLVLNLGSGGIALEKETGDIVWASESADPGYSTPLPFKFKGNDYVVLSSAKYYLAANANTGEELWSHRWMTRFGINASDPIIQGDHVFISTGYRKGATLLKWTETAEPEVVWKEKTMSNQMNSSVLIDGHLYGIDGDTNSDDTTLKCIDFMTGEDKWTHPGVGPGSLTAADGKLIVLSADGELMIAPASPKDFVPFASAKVLDGKCWTVPVLANGMIYCRNATGDLVAVDARP